MSTRKYLLSKIFQAVLTLLFVLVFNFFLFRGLGDPTQLLAKQRGNLTPAALEALRSELGLDLPLPQQFVNYLKQTAQGNLGLTFDNQPVSTEIKDAIWPTILLIGTSTIASIVIGIWIGIRQGWKRGSRFDQGALGVTLILYSMPEFWFGLLMIMLFSVTWNNLPVGRDGDGSVDLDGNSAYRRCPESPRATLLRAHGVVPGRVLVDHALVADGGAWR